MLITSELVFRVFKVCSYPATNILMENLNAVFLNYLGDSLILWTCLKFLNFCYDSSITEKDFVIGKRASIRWRAWASHFVAAESAILYE